MRDAYFDRDRILQQKGLEERLQGMLDCYRSQFQTIKTPKTSALIKGVTIHYVEAHRAPRRRSARRE